MRLRLLSILAASMLVLSLAGCGSKGSSSDGSTTGVMTTGQLPEVKIDGTTMRLAPGARIYNTSNLTITPGQVPAESRVRYKTDSSGQVTQVWLLP